MKHTAENKPKTGKVSQNTGKTLLSSDTAQGRSDIHRYLHPTHRHNGTILHNVPYNTRHNDTKR